MTQMWCGIVEIAAIAGQARQREHWCSGALVREEQIGTIWCAEHWHQSDRANSGIPVKSSRT